MPIPHTHHEGHKTRFGPFAFDSQTEELWKDGLKLKLQGQPLKVLAILLEKPGELVTREEIRQRLWSADTFVDFEHSLNTDIKRLREVLGEEAETPRFIETLRGKGYRFVAKAGTAMIVPEYPLPTLEATASTATGLGGRKRSSRRLLTAIFASVVMVAIVAPLHSPPLKIAGTRRLTRTPYHKAHRSLTSIVTDGARVYFREYREGTWAISQVSTAGGDVSTLPSDYAELLYIEDISPDLSELLISDIKFGQPCCRLWRAPLPSGPVRPIPASSSFWAFYTMDGRSVLYTPRDDKGLYQADIDGGRPHRILSTPDLSCPRLSPDGMRVRFTVAPDPQRTPVIWESTMDGTRQHPLFSDEHTPAICGVWSPNGKLYAFHRWDGTRWNLWVLREGNNWFGFGRQEPIQLTFGPLSYLPSTFSRDSKTLYSIGVDARGELSVYNGSSGESIPYLSGISVSYVTFSRDGQWVAYVSYPDATLWRSRIDGSERRQLSSPPIIPILPRWSPDGKMIVFADVTDWFHTGGNIYLVSSEGGSPMLLLAGSFSPYDPTWSPDGASIAYGGTLKGMNAESSEVRILDLKSLTSRPVLGSKDFWSPRWSPDGQYLVALSGDARSLWFYTFANNRWAKLLSEDRVIGWAEWSHDSRYVYVSRGDDDILRVDISRRQVEVVLRIKDIPRTGFWGNSFTLTPDDKILLLRNTGSEDLYAFDLQNP